MSVIIFLLSVILYASGLPNLNERIINGHDTDIKNVPFIVGVYADNRTYCAGSILNETTIITAAHCVHDDQMYIFAGITRKTRPVLTKVVASKVHWDSVIEKGINDVAILFLEKPLIFGESIQKIKMVDEGEYFPDGTAATIAGWGAKLYGGPMSPILQSGQVPLVNHEECEKMYLEELHFDVRPVMLCAGGKEFGETVACAGDSGGPLVVNGKLAGVLSMGHNCEFPSIFTDLANSIVREFIKTYTSL